MNKRDQVLKVDINILLINTSNREIKCFKVCYLKFVLI